MLKYLIKTLIIVNSIQYKCIYNYKYQNPHNLKIYKPMQHPNSQYLTATQQQICSYAQQFVKATNAQIQHKLQNSNWRDIYAIIINPNVDNNTRIVCCSVMKWLVYHTKFVDNPLELFKQFLVFYCEKKEENSYNLTKAQEIVEIVLKAIPSQYFTEKEKWAVIEELENALSANIEQSPRILKVLQLIMEDIQAQTVNNEVSVGELLIFLENIIKPNEQSAKIDPQLKIKAISQTFKLMQSIINIINDDDLAGSNVVEELLSRSDRAKNILQQIISEASNMKQIITNSKQVNALKLLALQLYSSIWPYHVDEFMFKLCLSSLITRPVQLIDEQADIMEKIVVMLQRSIAVQEYYTYVHSNMQLITISLISLLKPKQSYLELIDSDPEQFVDILYDMCMEQQREMLQVRVAGLLSHLCMYIDGYISFIGSMCIMVIKRFNGTLSQLPGGEEYMKNIDALWGGRDEEKVATCALLLASFSDQLQKRQDLSRPLSVQLSNMVHLFQPQTCKLPPYIICRFMFLYSFMGHPKYLQAFLPYKTIKQVYQYQLQSCYKILVRYHAKYPQYKPYVQSFGQHVILGNRLTPLLQTAITTGQLTYSLQFQILQKLVLWFQEGINVGDRVVCSKISNLITILVDRMVVDDYKQCEEAVFGYLQPLCRMVMTESGQEAEQFLLQIIVAHIRRFPNLQKQPQRLLYFLNIGFKVVERNKGTLNSCLQLFYQLTRYLSYDLICSLIQIYFGCLQCQTREQDHWQCYYGLECCMLRIRQLKQKVPSMSIPFVMQRIQQYECEHLQIKALMFIMSAIVADPHSEYKYQQYLYDKSLVVNVPVYENKPYCYYVLNIAQYLPTTQLNSYCLLVFLLQLLKREKDITKQLDKYEKQLYNNMHKHHQVIINAYSISRRLLHPLLTTNVDIYYEFRKCWSNYQHKEYMLAHLDQDWLDYLKELCTQATVNQKVRQIYKVKMDYKNNSSNDGTEMKDGNHQNNQNQMT